MKEFYLVWRHEKYRAYRRRILAEKLTKCDEAIITVTAKNFHEADILADNHTKARLNNIG